MRVAISLNASIGALKWSSPAWLLLQDIRGPYSYATLLCRIRSPYISTQIPQTPLRCSHIRPSPSSLRRSLRLLQQCFLFLSLCTHEVLSFPPFSSINPEIFYTCIYSHKLHGTATGIRSLGARLALSSRRKPFVLGSNRTLLSYHSRSPISKPRPSSLYPSNKPITASLHHLYAGDAVHTAALMDQMNSHFSTDAGKALTKKIDLVYQIHIAPKKLGFNEEIYVVDLKKGEVTKGPYEGGKPDATFSFTDVDFFKIATGNMNPQIAFMRGKMKVKGSLSAAQKFTPDIFPKPSKM